MCHMPQRAPEPIPGTTFVSVCSDNVTAIRREKLKDTYEIISGDISIKIDEA